MYMGSLFIKIAQKTLKFNFRQVFHYRIFEYQQAAEVTVYADAFG